MKEAYARVSGLHPALAHKNAICAVLLVVIWQATILTRGVSAGDDLAKGFATPPPSARPWVYWFWINGNISKSGITADLEAMKRVGIGGVLWMEVSGMAWAPDGPVTPASPQWHGWPHRPPVGDELPLPAAA